MVDNKKEQERDELHRTIWNMANDLRGSTNGCWLDCYMFVMLIIIIQRKIDRYSIDI